MGGERVDRAEAVELIERAPLVELMARADAVRRRWNPTDDVTFVVDTNPNYTNVCVTDCTFCSFYRRPGHAEAYVLSPEAVGRKAAEAQAAGATTILLQGGHHPELTFDYYASLATAIAEAAPGLHRHLFSPPEIDHMSRISDLDAAEVLRRLWALGLRTLPGGGAEILSDRVRRRVSPKKISSDRWLEVMRLAHEAGFRTSATMTYGHLETVEDIVEHLMRLRTLQDETGGFYAFIPWSFKPGVSALSRRVAATAPSSRYARIIAVARIVLDNFPHIQASWFGEGRRAGQLALHAGADDFGGLLIEENVLFEARHRHATSLGGLLRTIREAGFTPVQRTTLYETVRRYETELPEERSAAVVLERDRAPEDRKECRV